MSTEVARVFRTTCYWLDNGVCSSAAGISTQRISSTSTHTIAASSAGLSANLAPLEQSLGPAYGCFVECISRFEKWACCGKGSGVTEYHDVRRLPSEYPSVKWLYDFLLGSEQRQGVFANFGFDMVPEHKRDRFTEPTEMFRIVWRRQETSLDGIPDALAGKGGRGCLQLLITHDVVLVHEFVSYNEVELDALTELWFKASISKESGFCSLSELALGIQRLPSGNSPLLIAEGAVLNDTYFGRVHQKPLQWTLDIAEAMSLLQNGEFHELQHAFVYDKAIIVNNPDGVYLWHATRPEMSKVTSDNRWGNELKSSVCIISSELWRSQAMGFGAQEDKSTTVSVEEAYSSAADYFLKELIDLLISYAKIEHQHATSFNLQGPFRIKADGLLKTIQDAIAEQASLFTKPISPSDFAARREELRATREDQSVLSETAVTCGQNLGNMQLKLRSWRVANVKQVTNSLLANAQVFTSNARAYGEYAAAKTNSLIDDVRYLLTIATHETKLEVARELLPVPDEATVQNPELCTLACCMANAPAPLQGEVEEHKEQSNWTISMHSGVTPQCPLCRLEPEAESGIDLSNSFQVRRPVTMTIARVDQLTSMYMAALAYCSTSYLRQIYRVLLGGMGCCGARSMITVSDRTQQERSFEIDVKRLIWPEQKLREVAKRSASFEQQDYSDNASYAAQTLQQSLDCAAAAGAGCEHLALIAFVDALLKYVHSPEKHHLTVVSEFSDLEYRLQFLSGILRISQKEIDDVEANQCLRKAVDLAFERKDTAFGKYAARVCMLQIQQLRQQAGQTHKPADAGMKCYSREHRVSEWDNEIAQKFLQMYDVWDAVEVLRPKSASSPQLPANWSWARASAWGRIRLWAGSFIALVALGLIGLAEQFQFHIAGFRLTISDDVSYIFSASIGVLAFVYLLAFVLGLRTVRESGGRVLFPRIAAAISLAAVTLLLTGQLVPIFVGNSDLLGYRNPLVIGVLSIMFGALYLSSQIGRAVQGTNMRHMQSLYLLDVLAISLVEALAISSVCSLVYRSYFTEADIQSVWPEILFAYAGLALMLGIVLHLMFQRGSDRP